MEIIIGLIVVVAIAYFVFRPKKEEVVEVAPYKVETPVVKEEAPSPVAEAPKAEAKTAKAKKPAAKKTAAKKTVSKATASKKPRAKKTTTK